MPLFRGREPQPAPGPPAPPSPAAPPPDPATPVPPAGAAPPVTAAPAANAPGDLPDAALADAMSSLWRAGRKLAAAQDGGGDSGGAVRQAARHLRAAGDAFATVGVTVQDHDGTVFDAGLALEVVAYEPRAGARGETVLETVRPCVYRGGRRIQVGQVIVATPETT